MEKGISVWLDVPLEALAQRISAVGTNSRPLLHNDSGDAYDRVRNYNNSVCDPFGLDFVKDMICILNLKPTSLSF